MEKKEDEKLLSLHLGQWHDSEVLSQFSNNKPPPPTKKVRNGSCHSIRDNIIVTTNLLTIKNTICTDWQGRYFTKSPRKKGRMNDLNKIDYIIIGKLQKSAGKMSFSKKENQKPLSRLPDWNKFWWMKLKEKSYWNQSERKAPKYLKQIISTLKNM